MRRVICVWLPNWPITRLCLQAPDCVAPDEPLAIVATRASRRLVSAVNATAYGRGLTPGQRLSDAKAIVPDLVSVAADPQADQAALASLARWAQRFTPSTAPCPPASLWLDVTGCARLWRGERRLLESIVEQISARGIPCRAAIADTFGAAWALARRTERCQIVLPGAHRELLPALPLKALRLSAETMAGLRRVGLKTIGEAMSLPRAHLSSRFEDLLPRLDQAMGDAAEAVDFAHPPTPWFESLTFADFLKTTQDLQGALERLASRLSRRLSEAGRGAKRFEARFFGADNSTQRITVATSLACRDAKGVAELLAGKLETIATGFGIEVVTLRASRIETLGERRFAVDRPGEDRSAIALLTDTLGDRQGFEKIWRFAVHESHIPERSAARLAPLAEPARQVWQNGAARPIRLLSRPELIEVIAVPPDHPPRQFRWRRISRRVRRAEGPERIAPEWWQDGAGDAARPIRDYYRVEDESGARYWLYRDGLYSDAGGPRWYIHGFLA